MSIIDDLGETTLIWFCGWEEPYRVREAIPKITTKVLESHEQKGFIYLTDQCGALLAIRTSLFDSCVMLQSTKEHRDVAKQITDEEKEHWEGPSWK